MCTCLCMCKVHRSVHLCKVHRSTSIKIAVTKFPTPAHPFQYFCSLVPQTMQIFLWEISFAEIFVFLMLCLLPTLGIYWALKKSTANLNVNIAFPENIIIQNGVYCVSDWYRHTQANISYNQTRMYFFQIHKEGRMDCTESWSLFWNNAYSLFYGWPILSLPPE